ncbi:restriction endonuclease subunit S [Enterobacteriaceae bacterium RIT691]|nr:restriction endonuclease subunit S [Enterobacteriaceae bacterium RIT691]
MAVEKLITQHIDTWTSALQTRSTAGRGSNGRIDLYGIKKLRELILELAVRGKLVPQDPNDEPASELLKRIAAEKAELVKQGKIKKQKLLLEISEEEKPFELPEGWEWTSLCEISEINPKIEVADDEQEISFVPMPCVSTRFDGVHEQEIRKWAEVKKGYTHFANGDIALAKITPCFENSKAAIFNGLKNGVGVGTTELHVARPCSSELNPQYILLNIKSPNFLSVGESRMTGSAGQKRVPKSFFENYPLPFPPIAEQIRIVETFSQLMTICDQLEQQSLTSLDAHSQLVQTLLTTLTDSQNAEELTENWARISQHFDTLFTTDASIDALKQTILQLAVMGKLVPQDPNDEPVNVLFERVKLYQLNRIRNKEIQKPKVIDGFSLPDISIPETSVFVTLNQLAFVTKLAGFEYTNYLKLDESGDVPVVRAQNVKPFNLQCNNLKYTSMDISNKLNRSSLVSPCLLMTFIGAGVGETCIFEENRRWHLAPNVAKIEPFADLDIHYMNIYLNSNLGRSEIFKSLKATAQPSLSMTTIREIVMVIPPLGEQKRIVLKTNSLLSICDNLKSRLQSAQQTQLHLADALTDAALS